MKRLIAGSGKNSPEEYNDIFYQRQKKGVDEFDLRRWRKLLKYYHGGQLIDLGCLDSLVLPLARKKYPFDLMVGIDRVSGALEEMQKRFPSIRFHCQDLYNLYVNQDFDYAVMGEIIEHLEQPQDAIKEAFRILKSGGILALSTPFNEAVERGAVDGERHIWSFDVQDIRELLKPYCSQIKFKILGSRYFPRYKYHFPNLLAYGTKI